MSKLAKFLISDLQDDWSKPSIKFFRSNGAYGYIVWLTIIDAFFDKREIAIETLVSEVQKFASRRTILDFIQKSFEAKFTHKIVSTKDKRKIFIEPSELTVQEYKEWSKEFIKSIV
jgi:hypothetical protein